jgi:hypothetical protein
MRVQNLSLYCRFRHGGVPIAIGIKVETLPADRQEKEGEYAEFVIVLPI